MLLPLLCWQGPSRRLDDAGQVCFESANCSVLCCFLLLARAICYSERFQSSSRVINFVYLPSFDLASCLPRKTRTPKSLSSKATKQRLRSFPFVPNDSVWLLLWHTRADPSLPQTAEQALQLYRCFAQHEVSQQSVLVLGSCLC